MLEREEGWLEGVKRLGNLHRKLPKMHEKPEIENIPDIQETKIKTEKVINTKDSTNSRIK